MSRMSGYDEDEYDWSQKVEDEYYKLNQKLMNSRINWTTIKSALTTGLVVGVLALIAYFLKAGTFFGVDYHAVINCFGLAALSAVGSQIQSLLVTPSTGNFVGVIKVK